MSLDHICTIDGSHKDLSFHRVSSAGVCWQTLDSDKTSETYDVRAFRTRAPLESCSGFLRDFQNSKAMSVPTLWPSGDTGCAMLLVVVEWGAAGAAKRLCAHKRFSRRRWQQRAKVLGVTGCPWTILAPSMGILRTSLHTKYQLQGVAGRSSPFELMPCSKGVSYRFEISSILMP